LAEPVVPDYGWFSPADLKKLFHAIHQSHDWTKVILVGGQSLTSWVQYYQIELPPFDGPYLTADADFLGTKEDAQLMAQELGGEVIVTGLDDHTPEAAVIKFAGEDGHTLHIDILLSVIGVSEGDIAKLAVPVQLNDWEPIHVMHPVLVLISRCANLERLPSKRNGNGVTQARVACTVVHRYLQDCLADPERAREALQAASRIATLAKSKAGLYVWRRWGIDVLSTIEPDNMPGQFPRSWSFEVAKVVRKREIAFRRASRPSARPRPRLRPSP
jgi:hypothetical protein